MVPSFLSNIAWNSNNWFVCSFTIGGLVHCYVSLSTISIVIFSVVDLIPFFYLFICPLSVAGLEYGRSLFTAAAASPGHDAN